MKKIFIFCCLLNASQHNPKYNYQNHIHSLDDDYNLASLFRYDRKKHRKLKPTDYRGSKKFPSLGKSFGTLFYDWTDS